MSVFPAYDAQVARATAVEPATVAATDEKIFASVASSIDALLREAAAMGCPQQWAWYRAGEQLHLERRGDAALPDAQEWPHGIAEERLTEVCIDNGWHCWPTGRGESVLGWLLAPVTHRDDAHLAELARTLGERVQADALARAQLTQRVLYEIAYLASSVPERADFLRGVHERLGTLIDAENFYLALYDRKTGKITYPYYVDVIDTDVVAAENYDILNPERLSMTGRVLTSAQPLFITAGDICAAERGPFLLHRRSPRVLDGRAAQECERRGIRHARDAGL